MRGALATLARTGCDEDIQAEVRRILGNKGGGRSAVWRLTGSGFGGHFTRIAGNQVFPTPEFEAFHHNIQEIRIMEDGVIKYTHWLLFINELSSKIRALYCQTRWCEITRLG